jgi:Putative Flp pilus-assembly TadE/G-like
MAHTPKTSSMTPSITTKMSAKLTRRITSRRISGQQSGQALIITAFGMVAFIAAAGLAVDMGYLRYQRRLQQSAADSAALAGAAAAGTGANVSQAATDDSELNGFKNGDLPPGVNHPIAVTVTGPMTFNGHPNAVQVLVTADHPNFFMQIFGPSLRATTFSTVATAQFLPARNCVYALAGGGGITVNANVNIPNCSVLDAENLNGSGQLTAASIGVSGTSSLTTNPAVVPNILQTRDPFANLAAPGGGGGGINLIIDDAHFPPPRRGRAQPVTVNPGSYTGISIAAAFTRAVNFTAGNYIIGANGLTFQGSGTVSGNGVMFYLNNGAVNLHNSQLIQFSAPTNGTYAGILFFQRAGNTSNATVTGANGSHFQGALYLPRATLTLNGGGTGAAYMILVAQTIHINTTVSFTSNYLSLPNGAPIRAAALVQ